MLDAENPAENPAAETHSEPTAPAAAPAPATDAPATDAPAPRGRAKKTVAKRSTAKKTTTKKVAASTAKRTAKKAEPAAEAATVPPEPDAQIQDRASATAKKTASKSASGAKSATKRTSKKVAEVPLAEPVEPAAGAPLAEPVEPAAESGGAAPPQATTLLFQAPQATKAPPRKKLAEPKPEVAAEQAEGGIPAGQSGEKQAAQKQTAQNQAQKQAQKPAQKPAQKQGQPSSAKKSGDGDDKDDKPSGPDESTDLDTADDTDGEGGNRSRRRRRGGRRRRKPGDNDSDGPDNSDDASDTGDAGDAGDADEGSESDTDSDGSTGTHRRRRRRRSGDESDNAKDDPQNTVTRVRKPRSAEDEITSLTGSTRLEAKKQRRREGREAGRRRAPIASEAEFLARREAVDRVMVIRQKADLTQIAVLEDKVLVEHYVARDSQTSLIGNVYLGRVQNVLPSMEAAFIDIGKGRNAVLYAGEVNWGALGAKGGGQRKIEQVLKSGQSVLVQVSKDPIGHKGARLTSQISIPGRFLVYVPDGTTSGISRKLPDTERNRLKTLLKEIVPDTAGVIVRTAAEGASEEELTLDVERLTARWEDIESKVNGGSAPQLLYGEPDLTLRVVRDLFTEDFGKLVVSGGDAWDVVDEYVKHIAPDLEERLEKYDGDKDVFAAYRIDEQIAKGLDRKVWLPSGGSLVVDRTEAMTVVDVNTGKFTGSGGNLEETVTRNNLEAAEEIVRQVRLRDIGGIIVIDFIDMVLESNRDLVLRRMVECLGRDRTRHQVAEVTSLGLVQMTRKRIGTGLLEAFTENCEHCQGRGVLVHHEPIDPKNKNDDEPRRNRRSGRNRGRGGEDNNDAGSSFSSTPSPKDVAAVAKPENADKPPLDEIDGPETDSIRSGTEEAGVDQPDAVQPESSQAEDQPVARPVAQPLAQADAQQKPLRQRRRSARREQGPAVTPDESTTGVVVPDAMKVADQPTDLSEPAAQTPGIDASPAEAEAPRVVTSVRRRSAASRPSGPPTTGPPTTGPPTGGTPDGGPPGEGVPAAETAPSEPASSASDDATAVDGAGSDAVVASGQDIGEETPAASQAHVPVKKRGSRNH